MDLNYTAEDKAFRQQVRRWLEENIPLPARGMGYAEGQLATRSPPVERKT